jgi:hypothetical protein
MPIPTITPTDRIIAAIRHLTDAIAGIQEAPPDKLQAILTLCQLLLGKSLPVPIPIDPPSVPASTEVDTPNIPLQLYDTDDEPIHMWDPSLVPQHVPMKHHHIITSNDKDRPRPIAIIKQDEISHTQAPPHPKPPICTWAQQHCTCGQHESAHVHLINSAITDALMPLMDTKPACNYPTHGYIAATQALLIQTYGIVHTTQNNTSINFIGAIVDDITGDVLEYRHLIKSDKHKDIWQHSFANELGRLFQGIRDIKGTGTCFFIMKDKMPLHKQATYGHICCNYHPQKDKPHRTLLTIGSDRITYTGNKSTPMADLVTAKLLINSTISMPNAKFYCINLANFYLMTPMSKYKYMRLRLEPIPDKIITKYNLRDIVNKQGWVYVEIQMGMYGLPQAGILANKILEKYLNAKGYYHCQHTPGLWRHVWRDIMFCLIIDTFGIKTTSLEHVTHLKNSLEEHYTVAMDWDGLLFCGVNINWNYPKCTVTLNMPKYIPKALLKFQHPTPVSPQHQPYKHVPIQYGAKIQKMDIKTSNPLSPYTIKRVQDIIVTLLYYGRAVNPTLLTTLSSIAARQANSTTAVAKSWQQLLDYVATHPNAGICYKACDMILAVHTNASYLSKQEGKSRASAHFYITNEGKKKFNNGAILTLSSIIKHVMSSASKAELAALYYGCKLAIPLRTTLEEMGHQQHIRSSTMSLTTLIFCQIILKYML